MNTRSRFQSYGKFITYLIAVVLINIVGITLFYRMDLTKNKVYSLSKASKGVVSTLSEPLTIKVFFTKDLPAPHNNTERYIHDLLEEYAICSNNYFNYRFYDVSTEEAGIGEDETLKNQEIANNYGIYPVQIQNIEKDEVKFQKAYMGLVIMHGDMIEKIPAITTTEGLEYKLTTSIQKLNNKISALLNLKESIRIKLVLSSSLKDIAPYIQSDGLVTLPEDLSELIKKLNAASYEKLSLERLDPETDEELESVVEKYNVLSLSWPAIPEADVKPGKGAVGLVMEHGDKTITIPIVDVVRLPLIGTQYTMVDMKDMEDIINEHMETLIDINEDVGYLRDHGTLQPPMAARMNPLQDEPDPISNFREIASKSYAIKDIRTIDIPTEGFNCLIIAGPKETFTEYELFQIDQFLMRGHNLALFLDAFNEVTPSNPPYMANIGPQYIPINSGLQSLLEHYGVRINPSYVMDENCFKQYKQTPGGGRQIPFYFVPVIKNEFINKELAFMKNIKETVVLKASPLELDEKRIKENGLKAYTLLASSEKSWKMSDRINLNPMMINPPPADEMQSMPLACLLEGEFPSYFEGKQIPEKESADDEPTGDEKPAGELEMIKGKGEVITKGKPAKIFLLGTSDVLKNNMIDREGMSTNATFVLNILDHLNDRDEIAVMRSKQQQFNPLTETGPGVKAFVKAFGIAGLPVLTAVFGLLVWFRRHTRQRNIQMMFQK